MTVAPGTLDEFLTEQRRVDAIRALSRARTEHEVADVVRRHAVLRDDGDAPIARRPQ
jgi:hypothetical protein